MQLFNQFAQNFISLPMFNLRFNYRDFKLYYVQFVAQTFSFAHV